MDSNNLTGVLYDDFGDCELDRINRMRVGVAADHGGFGLMIHLRTELEIRGCEVIDFGADELRVGDDYPDFVIPMARAVAAGKVDRGLAICGSGVGACIAANKVPGVRAALISDSFTAHQGVEDDNVNVMCLGGMVIGESLAWELVQVFLGAQFKSEVRFRRRLATIEAYERNLLRN